MKTFSSYLQEHQNCGTPDCCGECDEELMEYTDKMLPQPGLASIPKEHESIMYMVNNKISLDENVFRTGSEEYFQTFVTARKLVSEGYIKVSPYVEEILSTDIGRYGIYEGEEVPLDYPFVNFETLEEEEKDVELNKPKRGGGKKFYVYVRNPETNKIKKIEFGDTTGLKVKINDPVARKSFAARHKCAEKNDKMTAGYWSCRVPRFAKSVGLQVDNPSSFW